MLTAREEVHLHDRVQSDSVDDLTGSIGEDGVHPEFEREVGVESDILCTLLTLGQLRENEEPLPSTALGAKDAKRLNAHSQRVQIVPSDATGAQCAVCQDPPVDEEGK